MCEYDETTAITKTDDAHGQHPIPLCAGCRGDDLFWTGDRQPCPLCTRGVRSGSWLICDECAVDAGVCVMDCVPIDGSSTEALPWLADLVRAERLGRESKHRVPRGPGRYSKSRNDA